MKKWLLILGMITCMLGLTACGAEKEAETPVLSEAEADELGRQIVEDVNQYVVMGAQAQAPNQLIADAIASWESSADDMGDYVEVISTTSEIDGDGGVIPTVDISKYSISFSFLRHISRPKVCIIHFP